MSNSGLIDSIEIVTAIGAEEGLNINGFNEIIVLMTIEIIIVLIAIEITAVLTTIIIKSASFVRSRDINQYVISYKSDVPSRKDNVAIYRKKGKARLKPSL